MTKFCVNLADFTIEKEKLGGQLALFLMEKPDMEAEAYGSRVVVKCEQDFQLDRLRIFLNGFMHKFNVKGKTLTLIKSMRKYVKF